MSTSPTTLIKPKAVVEIERVGFGWTEVAQFDLTRLSPDKRVQVREDGHYAPKESVARYAIQMGETQFPPIIVTSDDYIVDGNTRIGAAVQRKLKFFPALVLDTGWKGVGNKRQAELLALAATLNSANGQPLTGKETREVVSKFVELGWKAEEVGRAIGVSLSTITAVKKELEAVSKLTRVGRDANGSLKGASLRALGAKEVVCLNDAPFRELATLAADAGLNASEISHTAKDARSTGSDTGALEAITALRTELGERIREHRLTGNARPPVSRQLRQHLGFVTKFAGREHELVETDPNVAAAHITALQSAAAVIAEVLKLQGEK